tara:strand:+ start:30 stop:383 length:354 start_codon:yes stop_codon:yes gene_type:complete
MKNKFNKFKSITDHKNSYLELASTDWLPRVELIFIKEKGKKRQTDIINIAEFINVKGYKANGNKLSSKNIKNINLLEPIEYKEENIAEELIDNNTPNIKLNKNDSDDKSDGQISLEL